MTENIQINPVQLLLPPAVEENLEETKTATISDVSNCFTPEIDDVVFEEDDVLVEDDEEIDHYEHCARTIQALHSNSAFEVRAIHPNKKRKALFNLFTSFEKANDVVVKYNDLGYNIFINLHPITVWDEGKQKMDSNLLLTSSSKNRCANGEDVSKLSYLLIDIDPVRKHPHQTVSASAEEVERALELTTEVKKYLSNFFATPPLLIASSGNGFHLIWRIDLAASEENVRILERCLYALAHQFNSEDATVDTSVYTKLQLIKLYGTVACKGEHTENRPWRQSYLMKINDGSQVVAQELLEALAQKVPKDSKLLAKLSKKASFKKSKDEDDDEEVKSEKIMAFFKDFIKDAHSFLDKQGNPHIMLAPDNNRQRVYKIKSEDFSYRLSYDCSKAFGKYVSPSRFNRLLEELIVTTAVEGTKHTIYSRIAMTDSALYYNLCNENRQVVKVTESDVKILNQADLTTDDPFFVQTDEMLPQVVPNLNVEKSLEEIIDPYLNLSDAYQKIILIVSIISWFWTDRPRTIIFLNGESGSGKSFITQLIQKLVDPSPVISASLPKSVHDLGVALSSRYVSAFDNLTKISEGTSNMLCQAVDEGTQTNRKLMTDNDICTISFSSALILNGISSSFAKNDDLANRGIHLETIRIDESKLVELKELRKKVEADIPDMLGAIFKIIQKTMGVANLKLIPPPRLVDFYFLAARISRAIWDSEAKFTEAFNENEQAAATTRIEEDFFLTTLVNYIKSLPKSNKPYKIEPQLLYNTLEEIVANENIRIDTNAMPGNASVMGKRIKENSGSLSKLGITIYTKKVNGKNFTHIIYN